MPKLLVALAVLAALVLKRSRLRLVDHAVAVVVAAAPASVTGFFAGAA